jgi:hypothetical protein
LTIHPRENDLVLGTYGRAIWIGDFTPVQELSAEVLDKNVHLFDVEPRARYGFQAIGNYNLYGDKYIEIPNEPDALVINYYLRADATGAARVSLSDISGRALRAVEGPARRGLNRVQIPLGGGGGRGGGRGTGAGSALGVGEYLVTVEAGGEKLSKPARVRERIR